MGKAARTGLMRRAGRRGSKPRQASRGELQRVARLWNVVLRDVVLRGDIRFGVQVEADGVVRAFGLHGFPDEPEGQARWIALPGEQAGRLPGARLGRPPAGTRHLLLDQAPGGGDLLLRVEGVDRLPDLLAVYAAAP